jgi:hypothetical protein
MWRVSYCSVLYGNGTILGRLPAGYSNFLSFPDKVFDRFDQQGGEDDESMHTEQGSTEGWIPLKQHPHCYGNRDQRINKDYLKHPFSAGEEVNVHFNIPSATAQTREKLFLPQRFLHRQRYLNHFSQ